MMTRLDPQMNQREGENAKAGMNQDTKEEMTMEREVAKPLTTLSAYFMTSATRSPPIDT